MNTADLSSDDATLPDIRASGILPSHRVPAHLARRFHQICVGANAEILMSKDLSPVEYAVLAAIDDHPGFDQRRLADRLGIDPTSTSQMLERLAARGLVDQIVDPTDRRARILRISDAGSALRSGLRPGLLEAQAKVMSALSADERATLIALLTRIVETNQAYAQPCKGRRRPGSKKPFPARGRHAAGAERP